MVLCCVNVVRAAFRAPVAFARPVHWLAPLEIWSAVFARSNRSVSNRKFFNLTILTFSIFSFMPSVGRAITINGTSVQQSDCTPAGINNNCTGTTLHSFTNIPAGQGTVFVQVLYDFFTKVKCINIKESPTNRTAIVWLNAGVASAEIRMSSQLFFNQGNGVTCGGGPVAGYTLSNSPITFIRDIP